MRLPEEWLPEIKAILDGLGVESTVVGAVAAVKCRATARTTTDLDLLVADFQGIKETFEANGFEVEEVHSQSRTDPFLIILRKNGERTDLLIAETDYQIKALERSKGFYLTPEDIIIHKLIAWRDRDRDDIKSILAANYDLDISYIEHWADEWDISDRWNDAKTWNG